MLQRRMISHAERLGFTVGLFPQLREDETYPNILVRDRHRRTLPQTVAEGHQLLPVRLPVAGRERVLNRRPQQPIAARQHRGDRRPVLGLQHSLATKSLDPLVVPVGCKPVHVDAGNHPIVVPERDKNIVQVAQRADSLHKTTADRVDFHRIHAGDEAHHVEVVNDAVVKDAMRRADVIHGRQRRVAGGDAQHLQHADLSLLHSACQAGEGRVEPAVEADEQRQLTPLGQAETGVDFLEAAAKRFLGEDRLAGLERGLRFDA